jgi:queuine tRNA-ribosyltransferase
MSFDELTSFDADYDYNIISTERTRAWAERGLKEHIKQTNLREGRPYQALYGCLQGGRWQDLREKASHDLAEMNVDGQYFDGFGLGGAFEKDTLGETIAWMTRILPEEKPRHLLGLSKPDDIFVGVENGSDTFDCVAPTREARHGKIYTLDGDFTLKKAEFANDERLLDDECDCPTCAANYSRKTLRAMLKSADREQRAQSFTLLSQHNVRFIVRLLERIRQSIIDGTYAELKRDFTARYYS